MAALAVVEPRSLLSDEDAGGEDEKAAEHDLGRRRERWSLHEAELEVGDQRELDHDHDARSEGGGPEVR